MIVENRRPTRKFKRRENRKFPYRKYRNRSCMFGRLYDTLGQITGNSSRKKGGRVAPFVQFI